MNNKIIFYFLAAVLALVILAILSFELMNNLVYSSAMVNHTTQVTLELEKLIGNLKDAETGHRGYLLTHNPHFLESFQEGLKEYPEHLSELKQLVKDNPEQEKNLNRVETLALHREARLYQTLNEDKAHVSDIDFMRGKMIMDTLHDEVSKMEAIENNLLQSRRSDLKKQELITPLFLLLLILVAIGILSILFFKINTDLTRVNDLQLGKQQSEEKFNKLFQSSPIGIALSHVETGKIVDVNENYLKMLGYSREEMIGHSSVELGQIDIETRKKIADEIRQKGSVRNMEFKLKRKSGAQISVLVSSEFITLNEEKFLLNSINDITERIKAEEDFKKSQKHFSQIFNVSPVAMSISYANSGRVVDVNEAWEEMFMMKRVDAIGKNASQLNLSDPDERAEKLNEISASEGAARGMEMKFKIADGKTIDTYISVETIQLDNVKCFLTAYLDITDRKRTEALVEATNDQLAKAQQLVHLGSWEWNIPENTITWSDELYRIYGVKKEDFNATYEKYLSFIHPDDRDFVKMTVQKAYDRHEPFDFYHRLNRADGITRIVHGQGEVILNEKSEPVKMVGTAQDVTEIKQYQLEIEQKNRDLEKMNAELSSFTYVASHDLQEPLRKLQMYSSRILEKEEHTLSPNGKEYFLRIQNASARMQQLIQDLLSYSRTDTTEKHFEETDLNQLLEKVREDLREKITQRGVVINSDNLPKLNLIPYQFQQLFTNIIGNSIKFSKPEVQPVIEIKDGIVDHVKGKEAATTKKYHHISISDNGIGFEEQFSVKIFGLFQRLHSRNDYEGTGIGLSICKKIVENHNGIIIAEAEPGVGATFHIYLPVS